MNEPQARYVFADPRLGMTVGGRFLVRVVTWIFYLALLGAIFTFLISSIVRLRFIGLFLLLILIDYIIHRGEGDVPIGELAKSGTVNVDRVMRPAAFSALERAFDESVIARRNLCLEVLARSLEYPEIEEAFRRLDVPLKEFKDKLAEFIAEKLETPLTRAQYEDRAQAIAVRALEVASANGHAFIEIGDLVTALSDMGDAPIDRLLNLYSVEAGDVERAMIFGVANSGSRLRGLGRIPQMLGGFVLESHRRVKHRVMNRAWTSRPTPTLDSYGTDFTDLARDGEIGFLVGHEEEYTRLVETLGRPTNPNALLVGEAGIGKEAIIQHLAFRLTKDDVPRNLFDKRLVSLELQGLVAGAPPDILNARIKTIIEEIYMAGNIILYIPDIHNLVRTSGTAYLSAADALMPVIMNNAFPVVGATYPKEFKQSIEERSDFAGAFEIIRVNEITEADAEKILSYEGIILEREYRVTISFGAIKRSVSLAKRYIRGKFLPASAEELLKSAVVKADHHEDKMVGPDLVTSVAEAKVHIPIHQASGVEAE
jgi:ATP-dependent Clp protease ATP-binding subunit ClpA